jgi:acetyltransferase-like isoleucine patch superfamily enzyme
MEIAMGNLHKQIEASRATIADDVSIGENSVIRGEEVILHPGVRIGDRVEIICDSLELGPGCTIHSDSTLLCPQIYLGERCSFGLGFKVEVNQYLRIGRCSSIGTRVSMAGQGISASEYLYVDHDAIIGGGGARGPRAFLTIGKGIVVHAGSLVNISEPITMADYSGISLYVTLLTHFAYQPVLQGYSARFAPITLEEGAAVYMNSIVLPGVTVGAWSTVGAGAVVTKNVPPHCMAAGNPAQVVRGPEGYPRPLSPQQQDALMRTILADYLTNLEPKGIRVLDDSILSQGQATVEFEGGQEVIRYLPSAAENNLAPDAGSSDTQQAAPHRARDGVPTAKPDITLAVAPIPPEFWGRCHFDLGRETIIGETTRLAEDLRDYLRRRAIRLFTGQPFQTLPLVNLQRLQRRRGQ